MAIGGGCCHFSSSLCKGTSLCFFFFFQFFFVFSPLLFLSFQCLPFPVLLFFLPFPFLHFFSPVFLFLLFHFCFSFFPLFFLCFSSSSSLVVLSSLVFIRGKGGERATLPLSNHDAKVGWSSGHWAAARRACPPPPIFSSSGRPLVMSIFGFMLERERERDVAGE